MTSQPAKAVDVELPPPGGSAVQVHETPSQALVPSTESETMMQMIERSSRDPTVDVGKLKDLVVRLEYDRFVDRVDDAYLLRERTLALAPSVHDEERLVRRRELLGVYRLEETDEHEFTVLLPPNVIA